MKSLITSICFITITMVSGCTSQQLYSSAQSWQRNECAKIFDSQERSRCMADTGLTYEEYEARTETSD